MRACNNNNMRNPKLKDVGRGYVCYYCCMPSSPVLLYIYIYLVSGVHVLLHIYCSCLSTFWHCHPYILQHFNGNVFIHLFHRFFVMYLLANATRFTCVQAPPLLLLVVIETHVSNNEEMAFNYTEVLVDYCCSRSRMILEIL